MSRLETCPEGTPTAAKLETPLRVTFLTRSAHPTPSTESPLPRSFYTHFFYIEHLWERDH